MENEQMIKQTKFGWVDLGSLPKNNDKIVWKDTIGCCIPFKYKDVCSHIVINDFIGKQRVKICVPDYVDNYIITTSNILNGKLGSVIGYYSSNFKHQVGDIIQGNMLITSLYPVKILCFAHTGHLLPLVTFDSDIHPTYPSRKHWYV